MTRANILIVTPEGRFKFQANSSAYPSQTMAPILLFATSTAHKNRGVNNGFYSEPDGTALSQFISDLDLTLGSIGNPSYFYEVDFVKQHVKVWGYKFRWNNAPLDWEERGWNCIENNKGQIGWNSFVKDKLLYNKKFSDLGTYIEGNFQFKENAVLEAKSCDKVAIVENNS